MSTTHVNILADGGSTDSWYGLMTRSRHERLVAHELGVCGIKIFLPTVTEVHHWSDRQKKIEVPLFQGYLFVRTTMSSVVRKSILLSRGTAGFIQMRGEPIPIPDNQIEQVQRFLAAGIPCAAYPFLKIGQRVRVKGGSLEGMEGLLVRFNGGDGLVISVDSISRSVVVQIEGYDVGAA